MYSERTRDKGNKRKGGGEGDIQTERDGEKGGREIE